MSKSHYVPLPAKFGSASLTSRHAAMFAAFCVTTTCLTVPALAQDTAPTTLPAITVEGEGNKDYKPETSASPKYTEPLRDTPQTINVVPREIIEDRGATTLRDVLRSVPGISIQAGEGGVPEGDNYTIRGFAARTDTFIDGVRDFGTYFRDPFNLEQVEVSKGPASTYAGRGSTGGALNQISKKPGMAAFNQLDLSLGTDQTKRITGDFNQPISDIVENAAFRLNVMAHDQEVADRDVVEKQRWGVAPSIAFGLGTPTQLTLSYFHLQQDDIPDRGHPFVDGSPADVDRSNFYGIKGRDYYKADVDILTAEVNHRFSDTMSLRNLTRYGHNNNDYVVTNPSGADALADTITPTTRARDMENTILINQTDLTTRFMTGGLGHTVVSGLELARETSDNNARSNVTDSTTSLSNPDNNRVGMTPPYTGARTEGEGTTFAVYAFDTIKVTEQWSVLLGARWDHFDAEATSIATDGTATTFDRVDRTLSWRAGVVYKPVPIGSIYAAYGTSFNPSGERLALNANTELVEPEKTRTYEIGTKWDVLQERLSLTAAVFRIEKTNARTDDPLGGPVSVLDGEQRVNGFEIGVAGDITNAWKVYGGYTFLDGKVVSSNDPTEVGLRPRNMAKHGVNLWTTYDITPRYQIGFGGQYLSNRVPGNVESGFAGTTSNRVPSFLIFDAMVSYRLTERTDIRLNVFNLTDQTYYDAAYTGHAVPGAGRTAVLSTSFRF